MGLRPVEGSTMRRLWAVGAAIVMCLALGGAPVAGQSPTPVVAGGVSIEVLSDRLVIPLEALPTGTDHAVFFRLTITPGASGARGSSAPQSWAEAIYTQSGTITGTSGANARIWHLNGSIEDVPAGVEYSARAGETGLSFDGATGGPFENAGPEPYVDLRVLIGNSLDPAVRPAPIAGVTSDLGTFGAPDPVQMRHWVSAPIAVTFQRVTLEPGASMVLLAEDVPMLTFTGVDSGSVMWTGTSVDAPYPQNVGSELGEGRATSWLTPPSGRAIIVSNAGEQPAVLLQAVLSPATD
jgi:hypothetical protein